LPPPGPRFAFFGPFLAGFLPVGFVLPPGFFFLVGLLLPSGFRVDFPSRGFWPEESPRPRSDRLFD
jgi:hypothetical protein